MLSIYYILTEQINFESMIKLKSFTCGVTQGRGGTESPASRTLSSELPPPPPPLPSPQERASGGAFHLATTSGSGHDKWNKPFQWKFSGTNDQVCRYIFPFRTVEINGTFRLYNIFYFHFQSKLINFQWLTTLLKKKKLRMLHRCMKN